MFNDLCQSVLQALSSSGDCRSDNPLEEEYNVENSVYFISFEGFFLFMLVITCVGLVLVERCVAVWGPRDLGPHSVCLGSYPNTL